MDFQVILTCNHSPWSRYSGGGQKSTHMLASAFARAGIRTCVVFSKAPWERVAVPPDLPYTLKWAFFLGLRPGISSPLRFLNGIFFLWTLRRLSGPGTVLHGNGEEASLLWLVPQKRKVVFSCRYPRFDAFLRGLPWSRPRTWVQVFFREPRFVALALAMRKADAIACTSDSSRADTVRCFGFAAGKCLVVSNGVDPAFAATAFAEAGQRGVLYYGRLTLGKGADLVLDTYARLPQETRALHSLKIIGQGPYLGALQEKIARHGLGQNVILQGWMEGAALAAEIISHRLVFLPSREESFGNTMVEVLVTGQSLLTSGKGSIPEVTGEWGIKADIEDSSRLLDALRKGLERMRPPEEIAAQREYFLSRYSWDATARRYWELYEAGGAG